MAELHWFPAYVADWLSSAAVAQMLPEQEGAYWHLLNLAWGKGTEPPSLPADDDALASLSRLGRRWGKLGQLVRAQFEERDGKLYNAKLTQVWNDQQAKHEKAVKRGQTGGKAKAAKRQLKARASTAEGIDGPNHLESEGAVEVFSKPLPAPAPGGALALGAPRAPALPPVLARIVQPAPPEPDPEEVEWSQRYRARLEERVDEWCRRNPDDAAAFEDVARSDLPPLMRQNPTAAMRRVMRERVIEEVSKRNPSWPTEDQFIAQQRLERMGESAA